MFAGIFPDDEFLFLPFKGGENFLVLFIVFQDKILFNIVFNMYNMLPKIKGIVVCGSPIIFSKKPSIFYNKHLLIFLNLIYYYNFIFFMINNISFLWFF